MLLFFLSCVVNISNIKDAHTDKYNKFHKIEELMQSEYDKYKKIKLKDSIDYASV